MIQYCDYVYKLWFISWRCRQPMRHFHCDTGSKYQLGACHKHEPWYRQQLQYRQGVSER